MDTTTLRKKLVGNYKVDLPEFDFSTFEATCRKQKYPVTAISGMSAAGKTELSNELMKEYQNMVFFYFGEFYRTITYYFAKEKEMTIQEMLAKLKLTIKYMKKQNCITLIWIN